MQARSFTRDRWCFHIGPIEVVWMRRPMAGRLEYILHFSIIR